MAVGRDAHRDEARKIALEPRLVEAEPFEHAGPEILDQHVGARKQRVQDGLGPGLPEIDAQRALVAVGGREIAADVGRERRRAVAQAITLGALHLDHVGAEIAEQLRAKRPREDAPQIDDADAGERAGDWVGSCHGYAIVDRWEGRQTVRSAASPSAPGVGLAKNGRPRSTGPW
jgi:hypothetical protein